MKYNSRENMPSPSALGALSGADEASAAGAAADV
jgi:hypothetical protein